MKKLLGIVVLGLLLSVNSYAANYLFSNNLYTNCIILVKSDPTSFESLVFKKKQPLKLLIEELINLNMLNFFVLMHFLKMQIKLKFM